MDPRPTPEHEPLSQVAKLQHRLYLLFVDWDPKMPGPWSVRRYIDGDEGSVFDIRHAVETGVYALGARLKSPSSDSGYEVVSDTLSSGGMFLGNRTVGEADEEYHELRAMQFNDLLARSTARPYGKLGRMLLRARFRLAI